MKLEKGNFIDDLNRWFKAYINQLKALSYSENTVELYNRAVERFIEYSLQFQEEMSMSQIKSIYITGFLSYLEDEAKIKNGIKKNGYYLSKSTKQTYFKAIRSFLTFISDNNDDLYTYERYFKKIKIADTSKMEEKMIFLSDDEVGKLLTYIEKKIKDKPTHNNYRNSLLVKLLLYGGLRISEALHLKLEDIEDGGDKMYKLRIYAKGGKEQTAFIPKEAIQKEIDYFYHLPSLKKTDSILRERGGNPWNRITAYLVINNLYLKAGIRDKRGLHLLRHTLAMRLAGREESLLTIKRILRHSSISTTTIYAKATSKQINDCLTKQFKIDNRDKKLVS